MSRFDWIDTWVDNRSRSGYAALIGVLTGLLVLLFSTLVGEPDVIGAGLMTFSMTAVYYALDPQHRFE